MRRLLQPPLLCLGQRATAVLRPEQRATAIGAMRRVECATATDGEVRPAALGPACREHALGSGAGHKKKNEAPRLVAGGTQTSDPSTSGITILRIFLSTYQIRCALRALNEAALLATIWNLRRATKIHGDIFVSNAHVHTCILGLTFCLFSKRDPALAPPSTMQGAGSCGDALDRSNPWFILRKI